MAGIVSKKHKFVFIHIPKTAGTSIMHNFDHLGKRRKKIMFKKLNKKECNYFKFAFIRNPWDRMVSNYFYAIKSPKKKKMENLYKEFNSCEDFLNGFDKKIDEYKPLSLFSQCYWLEDEDGNIKMDYIGKFENLPKDLKFICDKIKITPNTYLRHWNKSNHKHYSYYYNDETVNKIAKIYKRDIELGNYKYGKK